MKHYVYQITNTINNMIYVGKRTHSDPFNDNYMGSGRLIKEAVKNEGIEHFAKTILRIFDTAKEAFAYERSIVNEDFVKRDDTYNLHKGGSGGFDHINSLPKEERTNFKKIQENKAAGKYIGNGTKGWTEETFKSQAENLRKFSAMYGFEFTKENNPWVNLSDEEREQRKKELSSMQSGSNNNSYGKSWYVHREAKDFSEKKMFLPDEVPVDWIKISEWKTNRKDKKSPCFGKKWYNDGENNYFLKPSDQKITDLNLSAGRIFDFKQYRNK